MNTEPTYPIDLITSYFAGESSPDDLVFLAEWLKADPQHREFFDSFRKTWTLIHQEEIRSKTNLDQEWDQIKKRINLSSGQQVKQGTFSSTGARILITRRTYRIAALLLILLIPAVFIYFFFSQPKTKQLIAEGKMIESRLPDGTMISLNRGSFIEYPDQFADGKREIRLTGEAYFEVTHDNSRPFVINIGKVRVEVLGTSFYVNTRAKNEKVEVVLASGKVAVYYDFDSQNKEILSPGDKAEISTGNEQIHISPNDDPNFISWKTGKLVFANDPLEKIVGVLNHTYNAKIRMKNNSIAQCRITATFEDQTLKSVLKVICATLNLQMTQNGTWTELSGTNCH